MARPRKRSDLIPYRKSTSENTGTKTNYGVTQAVRRNAEETARIRRPKKNTSLVNALLLGTGAGSAQQELAHQIVTGGNQSDLSGGFLTAGAFSDGYQLGDISKTIVGTAKDIRQDLYTGAMRPAENTFDTMAYLAGLGGTGAAQPFVADQTRQQWLSELIKKDIIPEEKIAKAMDILTGGASPVGGGLIGEAIVYGDDIEELSVLGENADSFVQSAGQMATQMLLAALGISGDLTMGITSFGGEVENALNSGATYDQAGVSGAFSAASEIMFEKLSGAIHFGKGATLDEAFKPALRNIGDTTLRTLANLGMDMALEGVEEVLSEMGSALGKKLTYMKDSKYFGEILTKEDAMGAFVGGALLSFATKGGKILDSKNTGVDPVTDLTAQEEADVRSVYNAKIQEASKNGKVSVAAQNRLWKESVGEVKSVQNTVTEQEAQKKQAFQADVTKYTGKAAEVVKSAIDSGVINNTKTAHDFVDFLAKTASDQGYSYTLTNKQKIIDNLIEQSGNAEFFRSAVQNGLLNNPQNADSFISEYAKTPQEQSDLKSFFDKAVLETRKDAYISGKNITLNMNSPKYMEVVVGHEITHSFEGSDLYEPMKQILFQIAKDKGEYDSRLKSIQQRYTDKDGKFIGDDNGDPEAAYQRELVADLVGEYLFKDESFVRRLSTENRNVFQKVYDKIKYLYRLATAGSKEARQLEKVKNTFEKIYREGAQSVEGTKNLITEIVGDSGTSYGTGVYLDSDLLTGLTDAERKQMVKMRVVEELAGNTFVAYDSNNNPVEISLAKKGEKIKTQSGGKMAVLEELYRKGINHEVKQEAVVLADELISASQYNSSNPAKHTHDWLDNNGQNKWDERKVYIQDKNKTVWEATLHIANSTDGRKILYDITPINMTEGAGNHAPTTATTNVPQTGNGVKGKNSLSAAGEATTGSGRFLGKDLSIASEAAPKKIMGQDVPPPPTAKKKVPKKRAQDVPPPPTARKKADAEGNGAKLLPVVEKQQGSSSTMADSQNSGSGANNAKNTITRKALHERIIDGIKSNFQAKGFDFDNVLKKAKNLSTFATVDNTPQRVMEKALGYKEGGLLADITVNQVAQNETEGIKWLNSFTDRKNGLLAQLSRQYNIKPGSKESAAAQMFAEGFYVDENNNIVEYGLRELAADFPNAKTRANIMGLASDPRIRQIYDDTLAMINESRTRNAYPEIPRLDNYFLHFRAMDDTFSRLGLPFNPNDIRAKDLPTDLNGVTADLKPGQPYFASANHRTGKRTSFDLLGGMERYLTSAKNQIFHIDDIQTLRALRNYLADTYGQLHGLEDLDDLSDAEAQERINQVYDSHLSTFAKFLNEEANILAGKTALIDRGLEGIIGRRGITFLDTINKQVGSNMVGWNISSSLTNFLPVAQTFAKTNKRDFVKAFGQTVGNKIGSIFGRSDGFTENSPVAIRRKGADRFYRTTWQKLGDPGYALMGAVDDISTELIARTKYNEFTRKGMDSQQAHYETDKWVSRLMGDRSLGQMPQLYNSRMLGLVTKFQLEVRNQLDSQFYDTIQETKASNEHIQNGLARNAKTAAKVASTFFQLAVAQHLFGMAFESVAGYNPAFDIIEVLAKTLGWDDDDESEDTALDNIEQGFLALLEDLPYTSTLTGGRIPIESALPIEQLIKGTDEYGNEKSRWETLGEIAPYYLMPGGYGQLKKTAKGLDMYLGDHPIAGSYTDSGKLRFPVEETPLNVAQSAIFGQWANENARDYFDNGWDSLNEKQTQEFIDSGMTIQQYHNFRDSLDDIYARIEKGTATDDEILSYKYMTSIRSEVSDLYSEIDEIQNSNLSQTEKTKQINRLKREISSLNRKGFENIGNVKYDNIGDEKYAIVGGRYFTWYTPDEDAEDSNPYWKKMTDDQVSKYMAISKASKGSIYASYKDNHYRWYEPGEDSSGEAGWRKITDQELEKQNLYTSAMKCEAEEYWEISYDLRDIKADKDENGKSISGSRKKKVVAYINSLDISNEAKMILLKKEYPSVDQYNRQIAQYIIDRKDITYLQKVSILTELGYTVENGKVRW